MKKIAYKKNNAYEGIVTYENVKYTEEQLTKLTQEILDFEISLSKKHKEYSSEYSYELGNLLRQKLEDYKIVESERYNFWNMLRNYVNKLDKRKTITELRDAYEYCYLLSKLPKHLAIKFSRSKWDYLFDVVTARNDLRLFNWLENVENKEFINSNEVFQNFCKALKIYFANKDTSVYSDNEINDIYTQSMNRSLILVEIVKEWKVKFSSKQRNEYFTKSKEISVKEDLIKILYEIRGK